ncbi:MAG TPA: hypothetical protein VGM87_07205 [Roseomonas sp.]|jgi:hypothetical protein
MRQFDAIPAVPLSYCRLNLLPPAEIEQARAAAYVADAATVVRDGREEVGASSDHADIHGWRARMYAIWFCYVFGNFRQIGEPLYAIEEPILEFRRKILAPAGPCGAPLETGGRGP